MLFLLGSGKRYIGCKAIGQVRQDKREIEGRTTTRAYENARGDILYYYHVRTPAEPSVLAKQQQENLEQELAETAAALDERTRKE